MQRQTQIDHPLSKCSLAEHVREIKSGDVEFLEVINECLQRNLLSLVILFEPAISICEGP